MKHFRLMAAALCAVFLLCGMAAPAYAYADETTGGYEETDPAPTDEDTVAEPEPTIEPGDGFSEEGNLVTRDLLYDKHTNKQFITVQTSGGSTFYIVIDYDKPVDEEGEQYETYFLGMVDEADLLAAFEETGGELPTCTCTDKCEAGAVNTDCPVCAANMAECAGVEPEPAPTDEPEPEPETEAGFPVGTLLLALAVVVIGGGAGWYFKIYRPKQERAAAQAGEDYGDEPETYEDEEDYDPYEEDAGDDEETEDGI